MPIVPRANPANLTPVQLAPQVRNEAQVRPVTGMADAVTGITRTAQAVYEKHQERNDLTAVMGARRQLSEWEGSTFDPENPDGIAKYRGGNALAADDELLPDLDKQISQIGQGLNNRQRQAFDKVAFNFRDSVQGRLNGHMTREHEGFLAAEQKATVANLHEDAIAAQTQGDTAVAMSRLNEAIGAQALADHTAGLPVEAAKRNERVLVSGFHSAALDSLLARDPLAAQDYFSRNAEALLPSDRTKVERSLEPLIADTQAEAMVETILSGGVVAAGAVAPSAPEAVQSTFRSIAAANGATITSMKRPVIAAGAGASSQHPQGTAADFRTRDKTPEQIAKLKADLEAAGFEVIDESDGKTGTGPHLHAELPPTPGEAFAGATTEADALERAMSIRDPRQRADVQQKIRARFQIQDAREAEANRASVESINLAVWEAADPHLPLRQILGPEQYTYAARKGMVGSLENDLLIRRADKTRVDTPSVVGAYLDTLRRDPATFARMDVMKNARHMTDATAKELLKLQEKARKDGEVPEFASESTQMDALVFGPLGIKGSKEADKQARAKFEAAYYLTVREHAQRTGKKPDAAEREAMMKRLTATMVLNGDETPLFQAGDAGEVPAADREQILAAYESRGWPPPDDATVRSLYLQRAGTL